MIGLVVALTMQAMAGVGGQLSPAGASLIAPIREAYRRIEVAQDRLPPATTASEKLERLYDLDQAGREALHQIDFAVLPANQRPSAKSAAWLEIGRHDLADQAALKALLPRAGWFKRSIYGNKASTAAFLIVQHATNDPLLMRTTLAAMGPMVLQKEASGQQYALMYDRIAREFDRKPQRYGSQVVCSQGKWAPEEVEDPGRLDQRRAEVGFKETEADYLRDFPQEPCD